MDGNKKQHSGRPTLPALKTNLLSPDLTPKTPTGKGLLHQPQTPIPQSPAIAPPPGNHTSSLLISAHQAQSPGSSSGAPSPASPQPGTPQSPDKVHSLPNELLEAGWRRFWSRREGREYFFNKFTKRSSWDMPAVSSPVSHDPLGIQIDVPVGQQSPEPSSAAQPNWRSGSKRRFSDEEPLSPTLKTSEMKGPFWDFTIPTSSQIFERLPCQLPPPHNDIEMMRTNLTVRLRQQYQELCHSREGINAPRDSFNRWLMERKVIDKGVDPMLPSKCDPVISPSMKKEILSDIPVKLYRPKLNGEARRLLSRFAESAKKMMDSRCVSSESRKIVKWNAEDTFQWLRKQPYCSIDDYMKRLTHLKEQCGPHLAEAAQSSVEGICTKVYNLSCDAVKKLHQTHWELLKEQQIEPPPAFEKPPPEKKYQCYSIQMQVPSPRLPSVEVSEEGDVTCLKHKNQMMKINKQHLKKLDMLYRVHCREDPFRHNFLPRVWCLLRRYQTFFGMSDSEGLSQQGALPVSVFKALNELFGVSFEWFASPLNCYFKQYCSAFADTDGYFGSRGPLFQFHPFSGSFEANPPFCEELMEQMVVHFEKLLEHSTEPLSIVVFIPDWRNPVPESLRKLEESKFKRRQVTVPAYEHEYRNGGQHTCSLDSLHIRAVHGTLVIFLQNDAGFKIWGPTDKKVRALLASFQVTPTYESDKDLDGYGANDQGRESKTRKMSEDSNRVSSSRSLDSDSNEVGSSLYAPAGSGANDKNASQNL